MDASAGDFHCGGLEEHSFYGLGLSGGKAVDSGGLL